MKEIKTNTQHYYENDKGQLHGEYKSYHDNGQLWGHCHFKNGKQHGEYKRHYATGQLRIHTYEVNSKEVHDFIKDGDSPEIRMFLYVAYAAPFLDKQP